MKTLFTRNRLIGLAIAAFIFIADQATKFWVAGPLGLLREGDHLPLLPFFDLTRVHNRGISLGMFQATSMEMRWALVGITAAIAMIVLIWMLREKRMGDIFGLSLILGGAFGNIRDRWELGYVLDFADFHIGTFRPFMIFNLADAAITVGVVIILARSLFLRDEEPDQDTDVAQDSGTIPAENSNA